MPVSAAEAVSPAPETGAGIQPNLFTQILRERPDAAARAAIVAVGCTLFWLTWAHWGSIQVDCGREVYVPYQILRGKLLYRDLWYPYGPLEPYVSALLLKLFGEHLSVLYFLGLTLAIGCALVLYELGTMLAGRAVGLAAALALLLQGFNFTIFNYIFPYTYSASMGLLFSLACLFLAVRHVLRRFERDLMLAGLAAGLALITKQEMGVSCCAMLAFVLVMEAMVQRSLRPLLRGAIICIPGFVLATTVYCWFFWKVTPEVILYANWQFTPGSYFMRTYAASASAAIGLRFVPSELLSLIVSGAATLVVWFLIARASRNLRHWPFVVAMPLLAAALVAVHYHYGIYGRAIGFAWLTFFPRGLFFIGAGFFVYTLSELYKKRDDRSCLAEAVLGIFALLSGIRVLAESAPFGYSIFYTAPLFLVFLIALTRCIAVATPDLSTERRGTLISSLLAAEVILLAAAIVPIGSGRNTKFQTSWGTIYLTSRDADVARQIYYFVLEQKRHGRQVLLTPELPMMYAFTGTEAPSRWYTTIAGYVSPRQEESYIADLKHRAPDYIVLTNRYTGELGAPYFGIDYDRKTYRWIEANYHATGHFGPFRRDGSRELAALLYQRQNEPALASH